MLNLSFLKARAVHAMRRSPVVLDLIPSALNRYSLCLLSSTRFLCKILIALIQRPTLLQIPRQPTRQLK